MVEQVVVHEELGRNTNAVWWCEAGGYNVLWLGTPEQIERYLKPSAARRAGRRLRRHRGARRAPTPSGIAGTAERTAGGYRIAGREVVRHLRRRRRLLHRDGQRGRRRRPAADAVPGRPRRRRASTFVDDPPFTHSYPHGHPTIRFDVEVPADAVLGGDAMIGAGAELQNAWFVEERIHIAARCVGAMRRLLDETVAWTLAREQFGARIHDHQGVSFPLADSAADAAAGRLLTYQLAQLVDDGADPKLVHAQGRDGQAVRVRGRLPLRRPLRAGVRRPRLHAHERRRAVPARAARRPDLGGHERDPAADRGARPREARRGADARRDGRPT